MEHDSKRLGDLGETYGDYLQVSTQDSDHRGALRLQAYKAVNGTRHEPRRAAFRAQDWQLINVLRAQAEDHEGALNLHHYIPKLEAIVAKAKEAKVQAEAEAEEFREAWANVRLVVRDPID